MSTDIRDLSLGLSHCEKDWWAFTAKLYVVLQTKSTEEYSSRIGSIPKNLYDIQASATSVLTQNLYLGPMAFKIMFQKKEKKLLYCLVLVPKK